jgi:hypothetical protein
MKLTHALLMAVIAGGLMVQSALAGSGEARRTSRYSEATTPLIVKRSPNIGYLQHFNLYIDGVRVATLGYGRSYEGTITPGLHFVTIKQMPHLNDAWPFTQQWIRVRPGETNVFTASWSHGGTRIYLQES